MIMKLLYPACFYPHDDDGYTVTFPDLLGCVTEGSTLPEAVDMAIDAASGWLLEDLENNKPLPEASDIKTIKADEFDGGFVSLISVDMDEYAKKYTTKSVRKNITIPAWMNALAERKNINFSQIMQQALSDHLGIRQP
jgi:predicted RNase H-like HicB family nuclease